MTRPLRELRYFFTALGYFTRVPVPRPTHSSIGSLHSRLIKHAADDVFAIPISPKPITLVPSDA